MGKSKLAVRVVADALKMFPAKVLRLLDEYLASPQLPEVLRLAEEAGYRLELRLKKTPAA